MAAHRSGHRDCRQPCCVHTAGENHYSATHHASDNPCLWLQAYRYGISLPAQHHHASLLNATPSSATWLCSQPWTVCACIAVCDAVQRSCEVNLYMAPAVVRNWHEMCQLDRQGMSGTLPTNVDCQPTVLARVILRISGKIGFNIWIQSMKRAAWCLAFAWRFVGCCCMSLFNRF